MSLSYFNSGLDKTFYTLKEIGINSELEAERFYKAIKYNVELLAKHYKNDLDLEYKHEADKRQQVYEIVCNELSCTNVYFKPKTFIEKEAVRCFLTPFIYNGQKLLAVGGNGMDLTPRLEAYQALVNDGEIGKKSKFFVINDASYFASAFISKGVIQEVLEKITKFYNHTAI
ncbi:MAG TPA: hypothetical protein LFW20_02420 [Rickettsia endosymbiont of Omalisus fontisbellaquei]|nr:hypothetical protein [Rickettsia endosymbiont of Omalisus fontisbellaquei]